MERNISPAGMLCIVMVAVGSVIGVSYGAYAIAHGSANEGNQEVVTQTEVATKSWSDTYNGKQVTGNQVLNLLNESESKGISVFISTRGIEKQLTTNTNSPVLKHNDKYYVNYGTVYNYEDDSYGYVNGEVKYDGNSKLFQVRDSQSLKTDYSPKFNNGSIVKNKDFSSVYAAGSPTFIESSAKFDSNLIYGPDGEITGVILSQSTKSTAVTSLPVSTGSGGNSTNAPIISKPSSTSGSVGNIPLVTGGSGGSSKPSGGGSSNIIPDSPIINSGSTGTGDVEVIPEDTKPDVSLNQTENYGVSNDLDISNVPQIDMSAIDTMGLGMVAVKVSDETPSKHQLLTGQYMAYLKVTIPGEGTLEEFSYIYEDGFMDAGNCLIYMNFGTEYQNEPVFWPFAVIYEDNTVVEGITFEEAGTYLIYPKMLQELGVPFEYSVKKWPFRQFYIDDVPYMACVGKPMDFWSISSYSPEKEIGLEMWWDGQDLCHMGDYIIPGLKQADAPKDGDRYYTKKNEFTFYIDDVAYKSEYNNYWYNFNYSIKYADMGLNISVPNDYRVEYNGKIMIDESKLLYGPDNMLVSPYDTVIEDGRYYTENLLFEVQLSDDIIVNFVDGQTFKWWVNSKHNTIGAYLSTGMERPDLVPDVYLNPFSMFASVSSSSVMSRDRSYSLERPDGLVGLNFYAPNFSTWGVNTGRTIIGPKGKTWEYFFSSYFDSVRDSRLNVRNGVVYYIDWPLYHEVPEPYWTGEPVKVTDIIGEHSLWYYAEDGWDVDTYFFVNGERLTNRAGMSWSEWVISDYNKVGYSLSGNNIVDSNGRILKDSNGCIITGDTRIVCAEYKLE